MEKKKCDIIQDLIPSYIDNICSEATKEFVEEHLQDCDECKKIADFCMNNTFSAKKAEEKTLDGLQKIRKTMKSQNLACSLILILMLCFGIWQFITDTGNNLSLPFYYILFAASLSVAHLAGIGYRENVRLGKKDWAICAIELLLDIYLMSILFYFTKMLESGVLAFGLEAESSGYFFSRQLRISLMLHFAFLIYHLICMVKQNKNYRLLLNTDIMGVFFALGYDFLLHRLSSVEVFHAALANITLTTAGISLLGYLAGIVATNSHPVSS